MKQLGLLALIMALCCGSADAQVRWYPSKLEVDFNGCTVDTSFDVMLVNQGTAASIGQVEVYNGLQLIAGPPDWPLASVDTVRPGDSLIFRVGYSGTLKSSGDVKTMYVSFSGSLSSDMTVIFNRHRPRFTLDRSYVNFKEVAVDSTARDTLTLANNSEVDMRIEKYTGPTASGWVVRGIDQGEVLSPGTSKQVYVEYTPTMEGSTFATAQLFDGCETDVISLNAKSHHKALRWTEASINKSVDRCPDSVLYDLALYNNDPTSVLEIDSVVVQSSHQWNIVSPGSRGMKVAPKDTLLLVISSPASSSQAKVMIATTKALGDTITLNLNRVEPRVEFMFGSDTTIFDLWIGESLTNLTYDIKNSGNGGLRFISLDLAGDPRWSASQIDTTSTITRNQRYEVQFHFAGATAPGDYPVTFNLLGDRCGINLSRTLIARVGNLEVVDQPLIEASIHPSVVSSILNVEADPPFNVEIVDLLGRSMLKQHSQNVTATLYLHHLDAGAYYVRVMKDGNVLSRLIRVAR